MVAAGVHMAIGGAKEVDTWDKRDDVEAMRRKVDGVWASASTELGGSEVLAT